MIAFATLWDACCADTKSCPIYKENTIAEIHVTIPESNPAKRHTMYAMIMPNSATKSILPIPKKNLGKTELRITIQTVMIVVMINASNTISDFPT